MRPSQWIIPNTTQAQFVDYVRVGRSMFFHARWMIRIPRVQRHFHIFHNAPDLPSQILLNLCFFISPGYYSRAKRN